MQKQGGRQRGVVHCDAFDQGHVFGGLVHYDSQQGVFINGMELKVAAEQNTILFDTQMGGMKKTNMAAFFPVSDESAARFQYFTGSFVQLAEKDRLPFYFSLDLSILPSQEVMGQEAIDLYGEIEGGQDEVEIATYQIIREPEDFGLTRFKRAHPEGLQRARANCVSLLNLTMAMSGIDIAGLHPHLPFCDHPGAISRRLKDIFDHESGRDRMSLVLRPVDISDELQALSVLVERGGGIRPFVMGQAGLRVKMWRWGLCWK